MRWIAIALTWMCLSCSAARADMDSLQQFLRSVEEAMEVTVPLRGDGTIEVNSGATTRRDEVAVVLRPPADSYWERRQDGSKWLFLDGGEHAYRFTKGAATAEDFRADAAFADTDFTREDLQPFRAARYKGARVADDAASELTVILVPSDSEYSLLVITFDRQKQVPLKTLYYRETLNNVVKMRRDGSHVQVGGRWLPATISMETFKLRTKTTVTLRWTQAATVPPELFDQTSLPRPSGVVWASETPAPSGASGAQ